MSDDPVQKIKNPEIEKGPWGVCKCGAWGEAPFHFRETKHFLVCPRCDESMYLDRQDPRPAGYSDRHKVEILNVRPAYRS